MTLDEIDELLAVKVMGWYVVYAEDNRQYNYYSHPGKLYSEFHINVEDWHPSRNLEQAFMVQDKMADLGFNCDINLYADDDQNEVLFWRDGYSGRDRGFKRNDLAEAIARAAAGVVKEAK